MEILDKVQSQNNNTASKIKMEKIKYEEALRKVHGDLISEKVSDVNLTQVTVKYSDALGKLENYYETINSAQQCLTAKLDRYYNYLIMLDPSVDKVSNPATMVATYRLLCLSWLRKSNNRIFRDALKESHLINWVKSRSVGHRHKYIGQQMANLQESLSSREKGHQVMTVLSFNQHNAVTVHQRRLPVNMVTNQVSSLSAGDHHHVLYTDSELFKLIAMSVINEAKSDNIRLLCRSCHDRSKSCDHCAFENTSLSLTEKENLRKIQDNMWDEESPVDPNKKIVMCKYLLRQPAEKIYDSKFSNYGLALGNSERLYIKLKKNNLLERFHNIFKEELDLGYYDIIEPADLDPAIPVYFSSINYVLVVTNVKDKLRPINNCSFHHRNGSLNENTIIPPCIEADPIKMLVTFRTQEFCGILDLKNAFKSLYSHESSNNIRNFVWIKSLEDQRMVIWRPLRVNFGSSLSSIFLHVARIKFVAKKVKTPEALASVVDLTFVDDEIFYAETAQGLKKVQEDICAAYRFFSFDVKHVFLSTDKDFRTQFLALDWVVSEGGGKTRRDTIKPNIFLSLENRKRGKNGEELSLKNLETLVLSKTVAARLLGVLFSYLQADINPILAAAKIHYSKIATVCTDWKTPIQVFDEKLHKEFYEFVKSLVGINERLEHTQRVVLPTNSVIERVLACHDAGTHLQASSLYIVSRDRDTNELQSHILLSKNKVGKMSIPRMELLSTKIALSLLIKFLRSCPRARGNDFPVYFLGDSEANTHNYNPEKIHKCVVTRNTTAIVMRGVHDVIDEFKNITAVKFAFLNSEQNSADLVSKIFEDPISVSNSKEFKCGDPLFLDSNFPHSDKIFLTVSASGVEYKPILNVAKESKEDSFVTKEELTVTKWPIFFNSASCCSHCDEEEGQLIGQVYSVQQELASPSSYIDLQTVVGLEPETYKGLLDRSSSFFKTVRTLARCKAVLRNFKESSHLSGQFDSNDMLFSFLTLIKSSQEMFGCVKERKRHQIITVGSILCFRTRIPVRGQSQELSDRVIPYTPSKDKKLVQLLIKYAHRIVIQDPLSVTHTNNSLTKSRLQSGEFATYIPNVANKIKNFISNCATCCRYRAQFITTTESTHRFFNYYDNLSLFSLISIDISAPVMLRPSKTDKKPRKYFILVVLCLVSKAVCLLLLEDYSKSSVAMALGQLQLRYSGRISLIISDNGTQLSSLDKNDPVFTTPPEIVTCPTANQVLNPVESITGKVKALIATTFLNKESMNFPCLTVIQASSILEYICSIYNLRAVSGVRQSSEDTVISPYMLMNTHLNKKECNKSVKALLSGLEDTEDTLLHALTENRKLKTFLTQELKSLLVSSNDNFLQKAGKKYVKVGDICLIRRGTSLKLVEVTGINKSSNYAKIEIVKHGKVKPDETHTSQLVIVHRPEKEE